MHCVSLSLSLFIPLTISTAITLAASRGVGPVELGVARVVLPGWAAALDGLGHVTPAAVEHLPASRPEQTRHDLLRVAVALFKRRWSC